MWMRGQPPGVYVERIDSARNAPVVLRTDIAAMIGLARRGPLDLPLPIESWRQFVAHFGDEMPYGYLATAVRGFFANGGRRVWIVRVAARQFDDATTGGAQCAQCIVNDRGGRAAWRLRASSPGSWGNELTVGMQPDRPLTQRARSFDALGLTLAASRGFAAGDLIELAQPEATPVVRVLVAVDAASGRLDWVAKDPRDRTPAQRPWLGGRAGAPLTVTRIAYRIELHGAGRWLAAWRDVALPLAHPRGIARVLAAPYPQGTEVLRMTPPSEAAPALPVPAWLSCEPLIASDEELAPLAVGGDASFTLAGGADGVAALRISDFLGGADSANASDLARLQARRGLAAIADLEQIALVAMPDLMVEPAPDPDYEPIVQPPFSCQPCPPPEDPAVVHQPRIAIEQPPRLSDADIARAQAALLADCEARDRFAVLDAPRHVATDAWRGARELIEWRHRLVDDLPQRAGALYGPWLALPVGDGVTSPVRLVPPSGHVLGVYARSDLAAGPMRAPANFEVRGVVDAHATIGFAKHGELNDAGVNVIRLASGSALGAPPLVLGARTVADDPQWRFVNVVRLVQALKRAFDIALRWAVFEPNSDETRAAIAATLGAILTMFFERGAFAGATPEESFYVRCDTDTTDADARGRGELIALVGIAPAAPAEFIVMRVGRQNNLPVVRLAADALADDALEAA